MKEELTCVLNQLYLGSVNNHIFVYVIDPTSSKTRHAT